MPRRAPYAVFAFLFLFLASATARGATADVESARLFMDAYPHTAMQLEEQEGGLYLVTEAGRFLFSPASGCPNMPTDYPDVPPLCATLAQDYPQGPGGRNPERGYDPGRLRNLEFFKGLYGHNAETVKIHCVSVPFLGESVLFNSRQGAAEALARVAGKLEAIGRKNPDARAYILPTAGSFYWRTIAGSDSLSAHSFGIAVDLNVAKGPYWRWSSRNSAEVRRAREHYPQDIVEAFESEGFIWGGKWYAFDFMHFEYRPELLRP